MEDHGRSLRGGPKTAAARTSPTSSARPGSIASTGRQIIKGMQQIIHCYTVLRDKEAMSEAVSNVRWLIAAGIRDFQAMLDELQTPDGSTPRRPAADEPIYDA